MSRNKKIILLIALLLTGACIYVYKEFNRTNRDLGKVTADMTIGSSELIKKFEADEGAANKLFMTKKDFVIAVDGTIKQVIRDEKGYYTVVLGDTMSMSSIRCSIDSAYQHKISSMKQGDQVTIQGAITGFNKDELLGADVILNRCAIIKIKSPIKALTP